MIQSLELSPYLTTTSTTTWICRTSRICTSTTRRGATPVLHGECHVPRGGRTSACGRQRRRRQLQRSWKRTDGNDDGGSNASMASAWILDELHCVWSGGCISDATSTTVTTRRLQEQRRHGATTTTRYRRRPGTAETATTLTSTTATTRRLQEQRRHGATTTTLLPAR